ncbi:hypothetical protein ACFS5M_05390 [Lacinutrix iliipiscaria]|uniref:Calx-beta domain-containing protein n=1 Tax=Lacinutrix iliipiscaria TaxID=1230532 RepID=A0ABW5WKA7_9FLAO
MKIIYNLKLKTFALLLVGMVFVSCNDDDTPGQDPSNQKPIATTTINSLVVAEGQTGVIPFTLDRATTKVSYFKIQTVEGGSATEDDDFIAGTHDLRPDTGNIGDGFEMRVDAGVTSFDIPVQAILDLDQTEGAESVTVNISAAANRTVLTSPAQVSIDITLEDFEYCIWTFEMTDAYGDGWNGGYLSLTVDGVTTDYFNEDLDGVLGVSETQTIDVLVQKDVPFSIDYVSGGGTGDAPGWESENTYVITAADGTVYSDGPVPTEGNVTSGANGCN